MKKLIVFAAMFAVSAFAGFDARVFPVSVVSTATNSNVQAVRGEVMSVAVTVPAGATGTVSVLTADGQTIFSKSVTASGVFYPRQPIVTSAGAAITTVDAGAITNSLYTPFVINGIVTTKVVGASSGTNAYSVTVNVKN